MSTLACATWLVTGSVRGGTHGPLVVTPTFGAREGRLSLPPVHALRRATPTTSAVAKRGTRDIVGHRIGGPTTERDEPVPFRRMTSEDSLAASKALARRDPALRRLVKEFGPCDLRGGRPRRPHFAELARMVCYQQLAGAAARAIHGRFEALFDGRPTPAAVLAISNEALR